MRSKRFEDHLCEKLRDREYALAYLEAAREDGIEEFLYAVREVASAQEGGFTRVAEQAGLGRASLYKSLSKRGNPQIKTLDSILGAMGMRFCIARSNTPASRDSRQSAE